MVNNHNDIDIVISKFLSGEATPDEAIFLEDWKAESADNRQYFTDAGRLFALTENKGSKAEINVSAAWEKIAPQLTEKREAKIFRFTPAVFRMAASILILIGIGGSVGYYLLNSGKQEQFFASADNTQQIRLEDGTKITMASNSSVTVTADFGKKNRILKLKGSAYFTVEHNAEMPFIIDAGNVYIKDLGTKFNVVSARDTLHVSVDEGIVCLYDKIGAQITLKAGEKADYLLSERRLLESAPAVQSIRFNFENKRLSEVVKSLSKAYGTQIELENNALANCKITTKFENEDLEIALTVITETLGLKYRKTGKGYLILGEACKL